MKTLSGVLKVARGLMESKPRWRLLGFFLYFRLAELVSSVNLGVIGLRGILVVLSGFSWGARKRYYMNPEHQAKLCGAQQ